MSNVLNTLRPRQNGRHFADDIFKCIFLNENVWIPIKISLKFVPQCTINNISALVQIMAWRRPCDKPLSEPMMVRLPTHICVTRPQFIEAESLIYASVNWPSLVKKWLVACPAPSHYLNQCWKIVEWTLRNKLKWNRNRNWYIFIQENAFEYAV